MPEIPAGLVIRVDDLRRAGYCVSGIVRWFGDHNLDWRDFLKNGIPASVLAATGDELVLRAIEMRIARG